MLNERDVAGMEGCLACDLTSGRSELPGGRIYETRGWVVEHCIGPLGVGTLIAKPKRHVLNVWELNDAEAAELGPLLRRTAATIAELLEPDQVYVCLWSHAGWTAGHIHFVVQPAWNGTQAEHAKPGPFLQVEMLGAGNAPPPADIADFAARARKAFAQSDSSADVAIAQASRAESV